VVVSGRWVASEIVNNGNHKQRVEIVKRFITIMEDTFKNNNFFTTMAIISGLNHSAVQRMKKTWRALPEKYQKDLAHFEAELSFSQSFKRYRELLADAVENQKPCIPFLAVHTKVIIINSVLYLSLFIRLIRICSLLTKQRVTLNGSLQE
jgi:hypothetical protein